MGQSWVLVDLDGRRTIGGAGKLGEWFWDPEPYIMDALRIPEHNPMPIDQLLQGAAAGQATALLRRLPVELYDMVMDELASDDFVDLLSFAVTCKSALTRSRDHILARLERQRASSLAGHRFLCVGEYVYHPDYLPPGMLTAEEVQQLFDYAKNSIKSTNEYAVGARIESPDGEGSNEATGGTTSSDFEHSDEDSTTNWAFEVLKENPSLFSYACNHFQETSAEDIAHPDKSVRRFSRFMPRRWDFEDWSRATSIGLPHYPEDRPWALCNLTKREYMDEVAAMRLVQSLPSAGDGYFGNQKPDLWHFLLSVICWSRDPSNAMQYEGEELAKGHWAGDRIAFTLRDSLPPPAEGESPWRYVGADVGTRMKQLWGAKVECNLLGVDETYDRLTCRAVQPCPKPLPRTRSKTL